MKGPACKLQYAKPGLTIDNIAGERICLLADPKWLVSIGFGAASIASVLILAFCVAGLIFVLRKSGWREPFIVFFILAAATIGLWATDVVTRFVRSMAFSSHEITLVFAPDGLWVRHPLSWGPHPCCFPWDSIRQIELLRRGWTLSLRPSFELTIGCTNLLDSVQFRFHLPDHATRLRLEDQIRGAMDGKIKAASPPPQIRRPL